MPKRILFFRFMAKNWFCSWSVFFIVRLQFCAHVRTFFDFISASFFPKFFAFFSARLQIGMDRDPYRPQAAEGHGFCQVEVRK